MLNETPRVQKGEANQKQQSDYSYVVMYIATCDKNFDIKLRPRIS